MSRFVRPSKYRHVYGTAAKKEASYDNVKVSNNAWDTNLVSGNGSYIAVNWAASGGGAFCVIPTSLTGKLPDIYPLCRGHSAAVLDTAFSPHDDSFIASGSDDGTVGLWKLNGNEFDLLNLSEKEREKAGGIKDIDPVAKISGGGRKIGQVLFHPTASSVLAATTGDHVIKLFDVTSPSSSTLKATMTGFTDSIQSLTFDHTGSILAATCRDRKLRTFDVRLGGKPVNEVPSHEGIKGARIEWCGNRDRIITTGFSKMSDRQMFLWDSKNLSAPIKTLSLDSSSGVIMPFWSDNGIILLAGKGDGNIRYYELESDELHYLTEHKSIEPARGMTFLPRRCLNASENEIARAYKVTGNMVQPISFYVPRRAESFQSDIFPPAPSSIPSLNAQEFFDGKKSSEPKYISLEDGAGVAGEAPPPSINAPTTATTTTTTTTTSSVPTSNPIQTSNLVSNPPRQTSTTESKPISTSASTPTSTTTAASPVPSPSITSSSTQQNPISLPQPSRTSTLSASQPSRAETVSSPVAEPTSSLKNNSNSNNSAITNGNSGKFAEMEAELFKLKSELAEKDSIIRSLEVENEKLKTNAQKVRDALSA